MKSIMRLSRFHLIVLATLITAAQATKIPREGTTPNCSSLVNTKLGAGIHVLSAVNVAKGAFTVPSHSGGSILNLFDFCHVSGSTKYAVGGDDTPLANGTNTLLWEL